MRLVSAWYAIVDAKTMGASTCFWALIVRQKKGRPLNEAKPMAKKPIDIKSTSLSVKARLAELGLTEEDLVSAADAYSQAEASATNFHPSNAAGTLGHMAAVATLRQRLVAKGWILQDDDNWPTVMRPDGKIRLAVATGNPMTGSPYPHHRPKLKHPKGPVMEGAIEETVEQLELFGLVGRQQPAKMAGEIADACQLYILLIHPTEDAVFYELSCPAAFEVVSERTDEETGKRSVRVQVTNWRERIVPSQLIRQGHGKDDDKDGESDDGDAFDVPVSKKK
jgi:hypothetical protein